MSDRRLAESVNDTQSFLFTLYINLFIWGLLVTTFEVVRHLKQVYLKRMKRKFQVTMTDSMYALIIYPSRDRQQNECPRNPLVDSWDG